MKSAAMPVWAFAVLCASLQLTPPQEASAEEDCSCTTGGESAACSIQKVHLRQDPRHGSDAAGLLSLVDAQRIFVQQDMPPVVDIASQPFFCMDDRVERAVLATPGGDVGEFILALDAYRDLTPQREISQHMVDTWLEAYLKSLPEGRQMVLCTDDAALQHLRAELQDETLSLAEPAPRVLPELTLAVQEFANVGDSHLRLMLQDPQNYHVDASLVKMTLRSFYDLLWNRDAPLHSRVHLEMLVGEARPAAFVEVATSQACEAVNAAPLLRPRSPNVSYLVSNLDAVSARRSELAEFFANHLGQNLPIHIDRETLHKRLDRHGLAALELTGSRVANGLPFYSLTFA
jgi:hypothetical protein